MREKKIVKKRKKQELELLYKIYKYRALSTAQIADVGNLGKWFVYKKIRSLKERGYLYSEQISGNYIPNQNRQGSYHRISGKGITLLKENDYLIDSTADELKVAKFRLPYLLTANDLAITLEQVDWEYRDSRSIKNFHNLNRGDILQGVLLNPNETKEYAVYVFLKSVQADTLARIKHEINRNPFEDILIITRGESSFEAVINSFTNREGNGNEKLIKSGSIKVLPFQFAKYYLTISNDNKQKHEYLLTNLGLEILGDSSNKNVFETSVTMDYIVKHNGEEKYFFDLLDNDLMKIDEIKRYRKERYKRDGRKALVLTSPITAHQIFHKKMLGNMQHVEYLVVDPNEVIRFSLDPNFQINTVLN